MVIQVEDILRQIKSICIEYGVNPILFGSFAKGTNKEKSNIDIAVSCDNDTFDTIENKIYNDIDTLRHINLINIKTCKNKDILKEINNYGQIL